MSVVWGKCLTTYNTQAFALKYWHFLKCQWFEANAWVLYVVKHLPISGVNLKIWPNLVKKGPSVVVGKCLTTICGQAFAYNYWHFVQKMAFLIVFCDSGNFLVYEFALNWWHFSKSVTSIRQMLQFINTIEHLPLTGVNFKTVTFSTF